MATAITRTPLTTLVVKKYANSTASTESVTLYRYGNGEIQFVDAGGHRVVVNNPEMDKLFVVLNGLE